MTECANCGVTIIESAVYDDHGEQFFCDARCFNEWADDNHEKIRDFYERLNVYNTCF